jgi:membrane associated rhomboid family serine protease
MPLTEMVVTVSIVAGATLLILALIRLLSTTITHRTIRKAVEVNPDLAHGLLERISARRETSNGDERLAIILVAIGVAMAAAPIIAIDDQGIVRLAIAASLFPLLVGGALWLRFRAAQRAKRRAGGE